MPTLEPFDMAQAQDFVPKKFPANLRDASQLAFITTNNYNHNLVFSKMSKTKTKRARRELKREGDRKILAHHRKIAKAAETKASTAATTTAKSLAKKNKKQNTSSNTPGASAATATTTASAHMQPSQQNHAIPFGPYDHILLVGEGDFSFTRSLAVEHGCANVVGTSYDTLDEVEEKYPTFSGIKEELEALMPPVPLHYGIDATKISSYKHLRCKRSSDDDDVGMLDTDGEDEAEAEHNRGQKHQGWDTIVFQFPHVGGLSTDQNRQVRSNQHLLVSFFKSCLDTPTPKHRLALLQAQASKSPPSRPPFLRPHGKIIVTLFEGEPYTLWNIRDLARHVGLKVVESWKFDAAQYPGYKHVRTLGNVENGWKGEDRAARMYVFEKVALVADSDEEAEMARLARVGRGGRLVSQKEAMRRAETEADGEEEEEEDE